MTKSDTRTGRRIAIVDDHGLIATALAMSLRASGHDTLVVDAGEVADTVVAVAVWDPDLVLHDLDLGGGRSAVPRVADLTGRGCQVLLLTGVTDPVHLARAVAAGASGIVDKSQQFEGLLAAVTQTLEGVPPMGRHEREEHLALLRRHEDDQRRRMAPFESLTRREQQVLHQLMEGDNVDRIAVRFTVSPATVRSQVRGVLTKLGVSSQLEAVAIARQHSWAMDDPEA